MVVLQLLKSHLTSTTQIDVSSDNQNKSPASNEAASQLTNCTSTGQPHILFKAASKDKNHDNKTPSTTTTTITKEAAAADAAAAAADGALTTAVVSTSTPPQLPATPDLLTANNTSQGDSSNPSKADSEKVCVVLLAIITGMLRSKQQQRVI